MSKRKSRKSDMNNNHIIDDDVSKESTPEYELSMSKRSRRCLYFSENKENIVAFPATRNVKNVPRDGSYLAAFFRIFDDDVIQDFLWMDSCYILSDKYLLAMVYAYFRRAKLARREYTRTNFFAALYLAHDVEEDNEDLKLEIYPWALGLHWRKTHQDFVAQRDSLLKRMDYRAMVSQVTCCEVINLCPSHPLWFRERKPHHGGAVRVYPDEENSDYSPRGPNATPLQCSLCCSQHLSSYTSGYLSSYASDIMPLDIHGFSTRDTESNLLTDKSNMFPRE